MLLSAREKVYDGPTHEAIARYRRLLADELDPAERGGGLREWGTRRGRDRRRAGCSTPNGGERRAVPRRRAARGSRSTCARTRRSRRPGSTSRCATRPGSSSPRTSVDDRRRSAGRPGPGAVTAASTSSGRRSRSAASGSGSGSSAPTARTLHQFDDAVAFLVYPDGEERGLVRLGGTWRAGANQEIR